MCLGEVVLGETWCTVLARGPEQDGSLGVATDFIDLDHARASVSLEMSWPHCEQSFVQLSVVGIIVRMSTVCSVLVIFIGKNLYTTSSPSLFSFYCLDL